MVQPLDVRSPDSGTYYFKPYSVTGLQRQVLIATQWGADPRDPYSNDIFQKLSDEDSQIKDPQLEGPPSEDSQDAQEQSNPVSIRLRRKRFPIEFADGK